MEYGIYYTLHQHIIIIFPSQLVFRLMIILISNYYCTPTHHRGSVQMGTMYYILCLTQKDDLLRHLVMCAIVLQPCSLVGRIFRKPTVTKGTFHRVNMTTLLRKEETICCDKIKYM